MRFDRALARAALGNAALVAGALLLTVLTLEGALRVAARLRGGGKEGLEGQGYTTYDPLLGWRKRPWARVTYARREYTVGLEINGRGLRDPERGYDAAPGMLRVLALGDSFVEGYTVPLAQTVTQQLEAGLRRAGRRAEVINGATLAYSTDQEYLFYRSEGVRYLPRVVLLFFYYNDVVYNDREDYFGRAKPAFDAGPAGLTLRRYPVRRSRPPEPIEAPPPEPARARSALVQWLAERLRTGAPRAYDRLARIGLWRPVPRRVPRTELRVYLRRAGPDVARAWDVTAAVLAQLAREVERNGSRLLVVYVPSRMEVQDDSWTLTLMQYARTPDAWDRGQVVARLTRLGARAGYQVLDLTPALRAADRGFRGRPYYAFDGHWTALGHRVAAAEVQAFLERASWLHAP
jgi:hypothetical protein